MINSYSEIHKHCKEAGLHHSEDIFDLDNVPDTVSHKYYMLDFPGEKPEDDVQQDMMMMAEQVTVRIAWELHKTLDIEECKTLTNRLVQTLINISKYDYAVHWDDTSREYTEDRRYYITEVNLNVYRRLEEEN